MTETNTEEPVMTRREAAAQWTRAYLAARGGRAPSRGVYTAGELAGHRTSTLQRVLKTSQDIVAVKDGRHWVWRLVTEEERGAIAAAHATDLDALEENRRDRSRPFRTVVTHWPCKGVSRIVSEVLDPSAPGGVVRRTSWVHSEPTNCNIQAPTTGGEAK